MHPMHPMRAELMPQAVYSGRVRRQVWVVLAVTMLLALLLPLLTLWHATTVPLRARACVWPAVPRAGTSAYVVVSMTDPSDRTAVAGPWAQVRVNWEMTTMVMDLRPTVTYGSSQGANDDVSFAIPFQVAMSGPWRIEVTLRTPGRPDWQSVVQVTALPLPIATATPDHAAVSHQAVGQAPCVSHASSPS